MVLGKIWVLPLFGFGTVLFVNIYTINILIHICVNDFFSNRLRKGVKAENINVLDVKLDCYKRNIGETGMASLPSDEWSLPRNVNAKWSFQIQMC